MAASSKTLNLPVVIFATAAAFIAAAITIAVLSGSSDTDDEVLKLDPDLIQTADDGLTPNDQRTEDLAAALVLDFTNYDGTTGTLEQFIGTPVVLNFFSITCVPCIREMPEFEEISQEFGDDVTFVGLAVLDRPEEAQQLVDDTGVTYFTARDAQGDIYRSLSAIGMPTTVLIDADGSVRDLHTGALSANDLRSMISDEFGV